MLRIGGAAVSVPGGPRVLHGVSLDVRAGETVCVVGESGSGKSVTALAVMGLLPAGALQADGGSITLEGEELIGASAARLRQLRATRMAMVFQEPMTALNPVQTVGRQVEEVLRLHTRLSTAERRARVLAMLEEMHLPDPQRIHRSYPHQLSGGQRQRIVICMALVLKPRLLIADEPTTALDVTTQRQILSLMRDLQVRHGTALMFITHDFGVVAELADRIVVMRHGRVVETGARDEVLARPREAYTRELVSSVPDLLPRPARVLPGDPALVVQGLGKVYGESRWLRPVRQVVAARDVGFSIRRGEIFGLVGESGSGKSTVARSVARLIEPSEGSIRIAGEELAGVAARQLQPLRRKVQIVFQDPYRSLNPRRRVGDSVTEGLLNFGMPREAARARAAQLLALVGLGPEAMQRYPHQFSGGQRQRICIARALALQPDVLVADEAVSALDVTVQAQVLRLLEEVRDAAGCAILFITHDLRVAAQVCDTIAVMQLGRVVESGPAHRVLSEPGHDYTRALLAAAPGRHWDFRHFRPAAAVSPSALSRPQERSS
ncbi:MAG: dipeptide ABC transporter ATP-binding protein [Lautropia sp.]